MQTLTYEEAGRVADLAKSRRLGAVGRLTQAALADRATAWLQNMAIEGVQWATGAEEVEIDGASISRLERRAFDPFATPLARQRGRAIFEQLGVPWPQLLVVAGILLPGDLS